MRCYYHPIEDAVAICKICGKGICSSCLVTIARNCYCKSCVETGIVGVPTVEVPTPTGRPSRALFIIGAAGSILNMFASLVIGILLAFSIAWIFSVSYYGSDYIYALIGIAVTLLIISIILAIGLLLGGIGYFGVRRNYGSGVGLAGFALSIVVFVFIFINMVLAMIVIASYNPRDPFSFLMWFFVVLISSFVTLILFGVTQILWGVSHIVTKKYTGHSGLALTTGIMLIISGVLTMTTTFVGIILFFASEILAAILFLVSQVPEQSAQTS